MIALLLVFVAATNAVLSALVIKSDKKNPQNRYFSIFLFAAIFWALGDALMLYANNYRLAHLGTLLFLIAPLYTTLYVVFFSKVFPDSKKVSRNFMLGFYLPALLYTVAILVSPSTFIQSLELYQTGQNIMIPEKIPYYIYTAYFNIYFIISYAFLFMKRRKSVGFRRTQLTYNLIAIFVASFLALFTNLTLPNSGVVKYVWMGPVFLLFFSGLISVAIIKHKLFDIRLVVVRSLSYALVISFVATAYSILVLGFGTIIIPDSVSLSMLQRAVYVAFALLLAISYQPLKGLFDKLTNRLFYRDAYDSQVILDAVSNVIVGNVDAHKVQKGALQALTDALRPSYGVFLFLDSLEKGLQKGDSIGQQWEIHDHDSLLTALRRTGKKIVVHDELESNRLREKLREEDIGVVAPLVTKDEKIGYLILGPKKSGNIYNSQDTALLNLATNELAVALQNAQRFEEIQAFNITLQEKITGATRELKTTNKKLIALDEAKDEFISMASHQLRTPLTSIKGYISMLLEGDLGKLSSQQQQALKEAFTSSQRMVFLISDFLNVSRIKTGKFVIELKELFMPTMIQEELTQLRELFEAKQLQCTYEPPEVFPQVRLDENKTRQVMMNMIDNAIYYTPAEGSITIQLYSTGDEIIFKVVDTGIGVPKSEQHKLFTKFFRAGNARKARPDGTGLGLYMAQKVVVEQGGSIIFESEEGKGSTFGFRFPLSKIRAKQLPQG